MNWPVLLLAGLASGLVLPLSLSMNARLRASLGSIAATTLVSFMVGGSFLALLSLIMGNGLLTDPQSIPPHPWWLWLGGQFGLVAVAINILLLPQVGASQTVLLPLSGQVVAGLLIDQFGWFGLPAAPLTPLQVLGTGLVLAGATVAVVAVRRRPLRSGGRPGRTKGAFGTHAGESRPQPPRLWLWRGAGVISGALFAGQAAVNGQLGRVLGSPLQAATVSFGTGALVLLVLVLVSRTKLHVRHPYDRPNPWWMWTGGMWGSLYVAGGAFLVPALGTGATVTIANTGMLAGSFLLDRFGLFGASRRRISSAQTIGVAIMIVGIATRYL